MFRLLTIPVVLGTGIREDGELTLPELDSLNLLTSDPFPFAEPPMSPRGRVIESFLPETLATLDERLADRLVQRIAKDEELDEYSPQLKPDNLVEFAPFIGKIELDKLVVSSYRTLIFTVKNSESFAVKYVHDCSGGAIPIVPHPLLTESWLGYRAASHDIGPGVYFVSPPVRFPANQHDSVKSWFEMTPLQHMDCYFSDATVRFALVERILPFNGRSLSGLVRERRLGGLRQAAEVAVALIPVLEQLHHLDMVHGDLGLDRVAALRKGVELKYQIVNYGCASFTDADGIATTPQDRSPDRDYLKSHWEYAGGPNHRYTKRDDLLRLLQIIASIMDPVNYVSTQLNMVQAGNMTLLMAWKEHGNFFVPLHLSPRDDSVEPLAISDLRKLMIRFKLVEIEGIVRECSTRVESSVYGQLVKKFQDILIIMNQTHSDEFAPQMVRLYTSPVNTTSVPQTPSVTVGRIGKRKRDF